MKRNSIIVLVLILFSVLLAADNTEFRATWVITWEIYGGHQPVETVKARIRKILDDHQKANMNAVLWQVRQGGTAYYSSPFEPWGAYLDAADPGFDPLAYAIEEAHSRGMELHAWFNAFNVSSSTSGAAVQKHPEWVCRNSSGEPMSSDRCFSPGLAAVRDYTVAVAMDLVRRYDIDGLHLDYVRWNEYSGATALQKEPARPRLDGQISESELADLQANMASRYLYDIDHPYSAGVPSGFASWEEWWRWSVTEFVHTLHDSVQEAKPWVRLSAAALGNYNWGGWQGYGTVYQDAALWFNRGYIDQLVPMHYHWTTGAGFYNMLTGSSASWGTYIQEGIAAGRLFSVGPPSYILSENRIMDRHTEIAAYCRLVPWVDGFQFFSYGSWEDNLFFKEAAASFFPNKTKVRAAKFLSDVVPAAPLLTVNRVDSLTYQVTVTLPAGSIAPGRIALYRLETNDPHPERDAIRQMLWCNGSINYTDHFDGLQDHAGSFYYYATFLDRFWNESLPSEVAEAGPVPSFAPQVSTTTPADGDTVHVGDDLVLVFSKGMDSTSVAAALSFTPAIVVGKISWSADYHIMTLQPAAPLSFATTYTLNLSDAASDRNGTALDGDADGAAGGSFQIRFTTDARDLNGPELVALYPAGPDEPMPVEGVINLVFNERILPASIKDSTILVTLDGVPVKSMWSHVPVGNRSVLSIQPAKPLEINTNFHLLLKPTLSDTSGNSIPQPIDLDLTTRGERTLKEVTIEKFFGASNWKDPGYSGSTVGTIAAKTLFEMDRTVYLPNSLGTQKYSAALRYQWDTAAAEHLCRVYLDPATTPATVFFDTTYTLQIQVFGDGSGSLLRLAIDEVPAKNTLPEVTQWVKIDWYGWRLVEWKLSDPGVVGSWLATNGMLDGNKLTIDSIQLAPAAGSAVSGSIYLDNLVVVLKTTNPTAVEQPEVTLPARFILEQNYPNPFNPVTSIRFELPQAGTVRLALYDLLGREVAVLAEGMYTAGRHEIHVDGRSLSSGTYLYRLSQGGHTLARKLLLLR
ncbi:MAG TPA: family 10 glycosylhydrolase [bacterium]|nr:family 10 glycosylhydrolase [bacterium]HQG44227.1 family 10 glycosylhydrolase [bacterium]HQJ63624.1 family 10 glycosylhydrolase [bacterium]